MASKYYTNNNVDTTTNDQLTNTLINKITVQKVDEDVFENPFNKFKANELESGNQIEEIETANLISTDFDATGANPLTKKSMSFKALYHKINREKTMKATVSDRQLLKASLSPANTAKLVNAIVTEMQNSAQIEDFEAFKDLISDICKEQKVMTICDLNGNGADADAVIKAVQVVAKNMTMPSTAYNFSAYKKAFSKKENLVLIMDSSLSAIINVDSLAGAFNMDKKALVDNIIVVDELPAITYTSEKATKGKELDIGETNPIITYKPLSTGANTVSGTVKFLLVDRKCLIVDPVERVMTEEYNAVGRFTNKYLHATDILSYSTLKNAVAFVD